MPTYVYRREDGTTFEIKQRITEDPLDECPETGQDVERIITGNAGLIFKGDGFHVNDYANGSGGSKRSDAESSSDADGSKNADASGDNHSAKSSSSDTSSDSSSSDA